jgi:hypothetical protein
VIILLRPFLLVPKIGAGGRRKGDAVPSLFSDIARSKRKCSAPTPGVTRRKLGLPSEPNQFAASRLRRRGLPLPASRSACPSAPVRVLLLFQENGPAMHVLWPPMHQPQTTCEHHERLHLYQPPLTVHLLCVMAMPVDR